MAFEKQTRMEKAKHTLIQHRGTISDGAQPAHHASLVIDIVSEPVKEGCPLLQLPREIRDLIYHMTLADTDESPGSNNGRGARRDGVSSQGGAISLIREQANFGCSNPLLRLCRQIREEGMRVYYRENSCFLRVRQGVALASTGHLALPLPRPLTADPVSHDFARLEQSILLDTFGPQSGLPLIKNLAVTWSHDCPMADILASWSLFGPPLQLLNMGFIGVGNEQPERSKKRDPQRRIGDDTLDWSDQDKVLKAYLAALPAWIVHNEHGACAVRPPLPLYSLCRPTAHWRPPVVWTRDTLWIFPTSAIEDMVRAMRIFKERCPSAMDWVEVKIEHPRIGE